MQVNDIVLIASDLTPARILEVLEDGKHVKLEFLGTGEAYISGIWRIDQLLPVAA